MLFWCNIFTFNILSYYFLSFFCTISFLMKNCVLFLQLTSLQSLQMSQFKSFNVQPIFSIFFKAEIGTVETGMDPIFDKFVQFYESNRVSQNAQTRKSQIHVYIISFATNKNRDSLKPK